jgi:endonuclease/exonuclease/phosphatase family metal-dependent hydrolase
VSRAGVRLTVGTFNIHHGVGSNRRLDPGRTADAITAMDADVVGLQEVDRHWSERSALADQAQDLAYRLDMHMVFGASLERAAEKPGGPPRQYGVALLSRYPVADVRNTLLPCPRGGEQRTLLDARLDVGGAGVRFLTTHLQHRSRTEREAQAGAISAVLDDAGVPTVLLGDLNARPDSSEVEALTEHLADAWLAGGEGDGFTYRAARPVARIDYVLASPAIVVEHARVVDTRASDHLPVVVDLRLPGRG